jgi:hypothetical protein
VRAEALAGVDRYGAVVPVRFTVRNDGGVPCFLIRMEALSGRRWTVASFNSLETSEGGARVIRRGLLLPGQELSFTSTCRLIVEDERVIFDLEIVGDPGALDRLGGASRVAALPSAVEARGLELPRDTRFGEFAQVGTSVKMPSLPIPFEPGLRSMRLEAWSYSIALGGFVARVSASSHFLLREDSRSPLPPADFGFYEDLDRSDGGVPVRTPAGEVFTVTRENALPWLRDLLLAGLRVVARSAGDGPDYELTR